MAIIPRSRNHCNNGKQVYQKSLSLACWHFWQLALRELKSKIIAAPEKLDTASPIL